jgi:hypothetical protein
MGYHDYDLHTRSVRAESFGYATKSADEIFTQSKEKRIHESMSPKKALLRESRDSEQHPNSVPIIIALDTTGSMGSIPLHLVREGLPKMVGTVIQKGIPDPQILFLGVGDHECDDAPLQVGQFESGDAELDLWLTRTWLEKGGGGNAGESYFLAWYFAANHTVTDSIEKRGQKGLLFTIGDEPCLRDLPKRSINEIMGESPQSNYSDKELLEAAQEKYDVYHLHILQGSAGHRSLGYWQNLLGQNCIAVKDYEKVADIISDIIVSNVQSRVSFEPTNVTNVITSNPAKTGVSTKEDEIL